MQELLETNDVTIADERRTFDRPVYEVVLHTASELVVAGPETGLVVIEFGRRLFGTLIEDFVRGSDSARARCTNLAEGLGIRRWVHNTVVVHGPRGHSFDVVTELWMDSAEALSPVAGQVTDFLRESSPLTDPGLSILIVAEVEASFGRARP
jgi:hypothetical protein